MADIRDIKRRIKSVHNTQQITRAMKMVAAAKMRKAQNSLLEARPYADKSVEVLKRIGETTELEAHPLLGRREQETTTYIVIAADRGLCGSYNTNILRRAQIALDKERCQVNVIAVGRKARDYFAKSRFDLIGEYTGIDDYPRYSQSEEIANVVIEYFLSETTDSVKVVYPHFINTVSQRAQVFELLPVAPLEKEKRVRVEYLFDPSPNEVLDILLPRYVTTIVHRALLEAKASEQGARMAAMDAATENAQEMIKSLTLSYNRARQAAITKEIAEIVGGAEALK